MNKIQKEALDKIKELLARTNGNPDDIERAHLAELEALSQGKPHSHITCGGFCGEPH